ncbi:MAG: YchF family ATPase [Kiritimatiellae bacterium]|nr:YchF family ATPase [Kiritimatiellia bacterium]
MALSLFLIGAPRSGKTAVFEALTNTPEGHHSSAKGAHRLGSVKVPDARLAALRDLYQPKKYTPAEVTFVDVALPPVAEGGHALTALATLLGEADAFVLVVQAFGDMDSRGKPLDPAAQLESTALELVFADLEKVETRLGRIEHEKKRGLKTNPAEEAALQKGKAALEAGTPLRRVEWTGEEEKTLRTFQFLSMKPALIVANVGEGDLSGAGLGALRQAAQRFGCELLVFCAVLEAEMAQLEQAAQAAFLSDYGLTEPARVRLIQAAYRLLNLISFFTVGEDEVRAWTIRQGTQAQAAAGKVHSDIERGFIRAETVASAELLKTRSWSACRDNATLRLEGKTYEVQDGDVIHFRFNA